MDPQVHLAAQQSVNKAQWLLHSIKPVSNEAQSCVGRDESMKGLHVKKTGQVQ